MSVCNRDPLLFEPCFVDLHLTHCEMNHLRSNPGNSEVHLDDLCSGDPELKVRMDDALQERLYPLVREAFREVGDNGPAGPLCVYDSILVRYNGDEAKAAGQLGASQPLVSML